VSTGLLEERTLDTLHRDDLAYLLSITGGLMALELDPMIAKVVERLFRPSRWSTEAKGRRKEMKC
jgi:hypothetical protein